MRQQIKDAISGSVGNYDTDAIFEDLHATFGLVQLDEIPTDVFWAAVLDHCTDVDVDEYTQNFCSCEEYVCYGECCGEGNCTCSDNAHPEFDEPIDDAAGYLNCGCHGSQRDHTCEPPF